MKHLFFLLLLLVLCAVAVQAQMTYYVATDGNDNNTGQSHAQAWQTLSKVNGYTFASGDSILFHRGQKWVGTLNVNYSGVKIGAFESGARPIISGSQLLTGWTVYSGNIYVCTATDTVKNLFYDGQQMTRARYPNTGWLRIESTNGSTTITHSSLNQGDGYWTGCTVRWRPNSYIYEYRTVTSHTGTTLTFSASTRTIHANGGFYLDGKLAQLDYPGEWYCNPATYQVYFYAPSGVNPTGHTVEGVTEDYGVNIASGKNSVTVRDLNIRYQAKAAIHASGTTQSNVFKNNDLYGGLQYAVHVENTSSYYTVDSNLVEQFGGFAGYFASTSNSTFRCNTIKRIGLVRGYGVSDLNGMALYLYAGTGNTVSYNTVDSTGYHGMRTDGTYNTVEYNVVKNVMTRLADGAGLYSYWGANHSKYRYNVIENVIGDTSGNYQTTYCQGHGIYLDNNSNDNLVEHNTIKRAHGIGILLNYYDTRDTVRYNNLYACSDTGGANNFKIWNDTTRATWGQFLVKHNVFYVTDNNKCVWYLQEYADAEVGTLDSNFYYTTKAQPFQSLMYNGASWYNTYYDLAGWRTLTGQEAHSSVVTARNALDSLYVNATSTTASQTLSTHIYKDAWGNDYSESVSLPPYSSIMLFYQSEGGGEPPIQANYYVSTTGNDNNSGTSEGSPWQTLSKVSNYTGFLSGDVIAFKRGDTWHENLTVPRSGITFDAYGTSGNKPCLDGGGALDHWNEQGSWQSLGSNLYKYVYHSTVSHPGRMWFNGTESSVSGAQGGGSSTPDATRKWYCDGSGVLTVYSSGGYPSAVYSSIEVANSGRGDEVTISGKDHVTFRNIDIRRGGEHCLYLTNADYITFDYCDLIWGSTRYGLFITNGSDNGVISNSNVDKYDLVAHTWQYSGRYESGAGQDNICLQAGSYWKVYNNKIADPGHSAIAMVNENANSNWTRYNEFYDNEIFMRTPADYGRAFDFCNVTTSQCAYNKFYRNYIHNMTTRSQVGGEYNELYYNVWDTTRLDINDVNGNSCQHSGFILIWDSHGSYNNKIVNNFFARSAGPAVTAPQGGSDQGIIITNNIFLNCGQVDRENLHNIAIWSWGSGSTANYQWKNNDIYSSETSTTLKYQGHTTTVADWSSYVDQGDVVSGNLSGNPNVDLNYVPSQGSPAIDAGLAMGYTPDYHHVTVPQGDGTDIGACEYTGQAPPPPPPPPVTDHHYYVKNGGNDGLDGHSDANAWGSIGKVNSTTFSPGDTVSFKRGSTWSGQQLTPSQSGSSGAYIVYNAYGSGAKPILDGTGDLKDNSGNLWNNTSWTNQGSNIWSMVTSKYPGRLWINNQEFGTSGNTSYGSSTPTSRYRWWHDGGSQLRVYATGNPATTYSSMKIAKGITNVMVISGKNCLRFEDMDFRGGETCIDVQNSDYLIFDSCNVLKNTAKYGLWLKRGSDYGKAFNCNFDRSDTVSHTFEFGGDATPGNGQDNVALQSASYWEFYNNNFLDMGHDAISMSGEVNGGEVWRSWHNSVHDNYIAMHGGDYGRFTSTNSIDTDTSCQYNDFYNNRIHSTTVQTQILGSHNRLYYNVFDSLRVIPWDPGNSNTRSVAIELSDYLTPQGKHNQVVNNTFYLSDGEAIRICGGTRYAVVRNNAIWNTGNTTVSGNYIHDIGICLWTGFTTDTVQNNVIYNHGANPIIYNQADWSANTPISVSDLNTHNGQNGNVITGNIGLDPDLLADFHLHYDSPCIDAGAPNGFSFDKAGSAVPVGPAYDVGAYEYGGTAPPPPPPEEVVDPPTLASPSDGAINQPLNVTLSWNAVSGATGYRCQVALDPAFTFLVYNQNYGFQTATSTKPMLKGYGCQYYWRVLTEKGTKESLWSAIWTFWAVNPLRHGIFLKK